MVPEVASNLAAFGVLFCFGLQISDVDRLFVHDGTAHDGATRQGQLPDGADGQWPMVNKQSQLAARELNY
jgi:hypothetical protein